MSGLRNHLNRQERLPLAPSPTDEDDEFFAEGMNTQAIPDPDDDQTMTGMMNATALNAEDNDADGDEELDDTQFLGHS